MTDTASFSSAAVAAPHRLAAEAGRDILAQGGDAIEAMVAMAATIAVVYPHMNSIGGDAFWLIRDPGGKVRAIESCGFAGEGATIAAYRKLDDQAIPSRGPLAALTVPGAVGGWLLALELSRATGGRLPLGMLIERAAAHAREGYDVSASEARFDPRRDAALMAAPGFAETFLDKSEPLKGGERRKLAKLAETLAHLAHAGLDDFYRGDVGREIAADLEAIGSPVARGDLAAYHAQWREPLILRLNGVTLYNTPAPTQGLASLILLGLYERLGARPADGVAHAHALVEAAKRAAAIRDEACVDFRYALADFEALLSGATLDREAAAIDKSRAGPWPPKPAKGDTVWMGAIDRHGRAVSFIQSVYWEFGSGCVLSRTGILMPNRGLAFSLDQSARNPLAPGRRPFHTLNPPLAVFDDGRVVSYGSMGGDAQPQFQAQVFTRLHAGEPPGDAVAAPRHAYGRAWGAPTAALRVEASYDGAIADGLMRMGHQIERQPPERCDDFGHAGALVRAPRGDILGAHDPRSDGGAAGL